MRSVNKETWTSEEPVSLSCLRVFLIIVSFFFLVIIWHNDSTWQKIMQEQSSEKKKARSVGLNGRY